MRNRHAQHGLRRTRGFAAALFPVLQGAGRHAHQGGELGLRHAEPVARFGMRRYQVLNEHIPDLVSNQRNPIYTNLVKYLPALPVGSGKMHG